MVEPIGQTICSVSFNGRNYCQLLGSFFRSNKWIHFKTYEFIAIRNHDVHFGRLCSDDFGCQRIFAQEHLTAIGFIDRYGRHFTEDL